MGGQIITGGLAIRYNNVLTVEFSKGYIDSSNPLHKLKDQYMLINAKVTKNHCKTLVNPYKELSYTVRLGVGTDITGEVIEEAIRQEIVIKSGAWIKEYNDGIIEKGNERTLEDGTKCSWNGMAKFNEFIDNNPEYFEYLKERVSGDIKIKDLSDEEIEEIKNEEKSDKEIIEEFEKSIEDLIQ